MRSHKELSPLLSSLLSVAFISATIIVLLAVGIWGVSRATTYETLTFDDGVEFIDTYRTLPDGVAQEHYFVSFARAHSPRIRFVTSAASSPECTMIRERGRAYMKRAAEILEDSLPERNGRPAHQLLLELAPDQFVAYHAYSSAGLTVIGQYIKHCGF